ncbi:MAG: UPF0149 family protein [Xanthomonadales bacterium]|nr:UPF0149 family protein [Xanthomonadales bacterium]MCE7930409.1 hypothetical protein [Xanthomonadales bacterium PRO6]
MDPHSPPDFEELAMLLRTANAGVGAADLHGSLCGFLAVGGGDLARFLNALDLRELLATEAERERLARLFDRSARDLDHEDCGFQPLLPDDERPLAERTQALLQWCQGFVGGLGLGGLRDERQLSEDGRELLRDFAEIAGSRVGHDEDEEVDEIALAELIEFARMGAILLHGDLHGTATRA